MKKNIIALTLAILFVGNVYSMYDDTIENKLRTLQQERAKKLEQQRVYRLALATEQELPLQDYQTTMPNLQKDTKLITHPCNWHMQKEKRYDSWCGNGNEQASISPFEPGQFPNSCDCITKDWPTSKTLAAARLYCHNQWGL